MAYGKFSLFYDAAKYLSLTHLSPHSYMRFSSLIGQQYPVYAVDDGVIQNSKQFSFQTIEEVAQSALPLLEKLLEDHYKTSSGPKPVILAGWSFGGVIATELGKLLTSNSMIQVQSITIFDSPIRAPEFVRKEAAAAGASENTDVEGDTNKMIIADSSIQEISNYHFERCTALLRLYYDRPIENHPLSCPIHDIRAIDSEYFIPFEAVLQVTANNLGSKRSIIPGTHWTIITGDDVEVTATTAMAFWSK